MKCTVLELAVRETWYDVYESCDYVYETSVEDYEGYDGCTRGVV
jgi:hypothetical protein